MRSASTVSYRLPLHLLPSTLHREPLENRGVQGREAGDWPFGLVDNPGLGSLPKNSVAL
jgi:hypothetical protein